MQTLGLPCITLPGPFLARARLDVPGDVAAGLLAQQIGYAQQVVRFLNPAAVNERFAALHGFQRAAFLCRRRLYPDRSRKGSAEDRR